MNHWRFPHNNSAPWDKRFPQNPDTSLSKKFWYQNNSRTQNGSATMIFGDVRQKNSTKLWYPYYPRTFWCQNISESPGSPNETLGYCETKKIDIIVIPLLSKKVRYQNNSETPKGSPTMICGDLRQKKTTKLWHLILQNCSIPEHFWNTRVPLRNFLVLWDKKDWQNGVTPNTQKIF